MEEIENIRMSEAIKLGRDARQKGLLGESADMLEKYINTLMSLPELSFDALKNMIEKYEQ